MKVGVTCWVKPFLYVENITGTRSCALYILTESGFNADGFGVLAEGLDVFVLNKCIRLYAERRKPPEVK